ncbi:MAG: hypothetical protein PHZ28_05390 [Candidatus Izemoplasmatales bacterium]|nr:hypothetical protein [Candidatus Izemoplasmatales bacterium]
MNSEDLLKRVDYLISKGKDVTNKAQSTGGVKHIDWSEHKGFIAASLTFIKKIFSENHPYYKCFENATKGQYKSNAEAGIKILESIKNEIENGWLIDFKRLVSADIFSDFLEMSKYLLDEGYKDAAAVMIGSVLESHLRQLCKDNMIEITIKKGDNYISKKAELMNIDLCKAGIYNILDQKSVTAWLDLRNKAAHGKYEQYLKNQVEVMYLGILNFIKPNRE